VPPFVAAAATLLFAAAIERCRLRFSPPDALFFAAADAATRLMRRRRLSLSASVSPPAPIRSFDAAAVTPPILMLMPRRLFCRLVSLISLRRLRYATPRPSFRLRRLPAGASFTPLCRRHAVIALPIAPLSLIRASAAAAPASMHFAAAYSRAAISMRFYFSPAAYFRPP